MKPELPSSFSLHGKEIIDLIFESVERFILCLNDAGLSATNVIPVLNPRGLEMNIHETRPICRDRQL